MNRLSVKSESSFAKIRKQMWKIKMVKTEDVDVELRLRTGCRRNGSASSKAGHWQQITILDTDEMQARAIILLAKKEMEQHHVRKPLTQSAGAIEPQLYNPRLAMRHSLQQFLQKRKLRISASSPYNQFNNKRSLCSSSVSTL